MPMTAGEIVTETLEKADGQRSETVAARLEEQEKRLRASQDRFRFMIDATLTESGEQMTQQADIVRDAAKDIRSLGGISVKAHEGNIVGQAMVGRAGTASVDIGKMVQEDGSIDLETARGVQAHEFRHQKQSMASHDILETDAMLYAEKVVPGSIKKVSDEYSAIVRRTLARYTPKQVEDIAMGRAEETSYDVAM